MKAFIEWKKLPKGTYTYTHAGLTVDVWPIGTLRGTAYKWTIRDEDIYLDQGEEASLDAACEAALKFMP